MHACEQCGGRGHLHRTWTGAGLRDSLFMERNSDFYME